MSTAPSGVRHSLRKAIVTGAAPVREARRNGSEGPAGGDGVGIAGIVPFAMQSPPHIFSAAPSRRGSATAGLLVVAVGVLMQGGSALAVMVIDSVGVIQALWLRTASLPRHYSPPFAPPAWCAFPPKGDGFFLVLIVSLLAMNFSFYRISRVPVGVVVAVEFLGPLGVAVAGSRRLLDVVWVIWPRWEWRCSLAPMARSARWDWCSRWWPPPAGPRFLLAKRAVTRMEPLRATVLMLLGASVTLTPIWLGTGLKIVGHGRALLSGFGGRRAFVGVAVLFLELAAIKRVRASTYGVLFTLSRPSRR